MSSVHFTFRVCHDISKVPKYTKSANAKKKKNQLSETFISKAMSLKEYFILFTFGTLIHPTLACLRLFSLSPHMLFQQNMRKFLSKRDF